MSNDAQSELLYKTRRPEKSSFEYITDLANLNYQTIGTAASIVGAIETAMAAARGSPASLASRVSIYLLPIAAFQFGAWLRERSDARQKERDDFFFSARRLIILLAIDHAGKQHIKSHPNSKLRDDNNILGFRLVTGRASTNLWKMMHDRRWNQLKSELETLNVQSVMPTPMGIAPILLKLAGEEGWVAKYRINIMKPEELWKAYVLSRFHAISAEASTLLKVAEMGG